jgi:hypothetical protein
MATDETSKALLETLISPNESDRNLEAALSDGSYSEEYFCLDCYVARGGRLPRNSLD